MTCWGGGFAYPPYPLTGLEPAKAISVGEDWACIVSTAGEVFCWDEGLSPWADRVKGIQDAVSVSVGDRSACAVHADGSVSCWGKNDAGQLGDGTTADRPVPRRIRGISDAIDVDLSWGSEPAPAHACALHRDGRVSCWGDNSYGQVGDGTTAQRLSPRRAQQFAPIPAADRPITSLEVLHAWMDDVTEEWQDDHPWVRAAWESIRDKVNVSASGFGGTVWHTCRPTSTAATCSAIEMRVSQIGLGVIVHELVHVYDGETGLAPGKAWGAVQLYFADKYADCFPGWGKPGVEILADTLMHLMVPNAWLTYHRSDGCPALGEQPSFQDEQVVLDGLAGKVPDWYTKNIPSSQKFWETWREAPSLRILANLAPEFGGLCPNDWVKSPLDTDQLPPADANPFRDSGC